MGVYPCFVFFCLRMRTKTMSWSSQSSRICSRITTFNSSIGVAAWEPERAHQRRSPWTKLHATIHTHHHRAWELDPRAPAFLSFCHCTYRQLQASCNCNGPKGGALTGHTFRLSLGGCVPPRSGALGGCALPYPSCGGLLTEVNPLPPNTG